MFATTVDRTIYYFRNFQEFQFLRIVQAPNGQTSFGWRSQIVFIPWVFHFDKVIPWLWNGPTSYLQGVKMRVWFYWSSNCRLVFWNGWPIITCLSSFDELFSRQAKANFVFCHYSDHVICFFLQFCKNTGFKLEMIFMPCAITPGFSWIVLLYLSKIHCNWSSECFLCWRVPFGVNIITLFWSRYFQDRLVWNICLENAKLIMIESKTSFIVECNLKLSVGSIWWTLIERIISG